ncbi:adenosylmethionine-8-amino-7-oxononanoate aminotransferase [Bradyrhizobium sp. USDA 3650]
MMLKQLSNSLAHTDVSTTLHPYTDARAHEREGPVIIDRGKGIYVYDDAGKEYIEGLAGLWSVAVGFDEPRLVQVASAQMAKLPYYHTFSHKAQEPSIRLAEKLVGMTPAPLSRVFFTSSGSEANDTMIKMVWYMNNASGRPKKKKFLARNRAYHGVTVASGSLTGLTNNHTDFDLAGHSGPSPNLPAFLSFRSTRRNRNWICCALGRGGRSGDSTGRPRNGRGFRW